MELPPLVFRPRFLPRDKYDWRLSTAVVLLTLPIIGLMAVLWFLGIPQLVHLWTHDLVSAAIAFWLAWLSWTLYFTLLPLQKVEISVAGIRYWRGVTSHLIPWEEIEAVEEVTRAEMFRLTLNPGMMTGKYLSAASLSLADYARVRYRGGTLLFPPENRAAFLAAARARRAAALRPATTSAAVPQVLPVVLPATPPSTTVSDSTGEGKRWYHTAYALREENQNSLRNSNR